jgi:WhiB family transcriptional regulator, redox-sensing transcriptional regulator
MDMDWRNQAACRDEDPELFYPVGNTGPALLRIAEAKAVCQRCPVNAECLDWALVSKQEWGVWGGLSEDERRALTRDAAAERVAVAARARRETELRQSEVVGETCGGKITAHIRTPENTRVNSRGQVRCRDCDRDTQARKRTRRRGLSERGAA